MTKIGMAAMAIALAVALAVPARRALADDDTISPTDERVRVSLGIMHVENSTNIRLDGSAGTPGTYINAENTLGLDRGDFEAQFQATLRVSGRHRLQFDYFSLDRTGNATISGAPVQFRDVTLQPGDPVQSTMSLRTIGISYEYSFWRTENVEVAAGVGINPTDISAQVKVQTQSRHIYQSEDHAGPVPHLGMDATWVLSRRFYLDASAQYLDARVDHYDASFGIYQFDALYRWRPNVSFALGYAEFRDYFDKHLGTKTGSFDLSSKGPQMFVRVAF